MVDDGVGDDSRRRCLVPEVEPLSIYFRGGLLVCRINRRFKVSPVAGLAR